MKEKHKLIINQLGIRLMFAVTLNFYIILIAAMFNEHSIKVLFNHFNEAIFEYIIYFAILPVIVYSMIYEIKETRKRKREMKYGIRKLDKEPRTQKQKID